jgi:hypothetical protein
LPLSVKIVNSVAFTTYIHRYLPIPRGQVQTHFLSKRALRSEACPANFVTSGQGSLGQVSLGQVIFSLG